MAKRSLPAIRQAVKECTSGLRLMFNAETGNALLILDDIDRMMDETRRADYGKVKSKPVTTNHLTK